MDKYYTPKEYAELIGINPLTVYRWIKAGRIETFRSPTGRIYIPEVEVPTFMRIK